MQIKQEQKTQELDLEIEENCMSDDVFHVNK